MDNQKLNYDISPGSKVSILADQAQVGERLDVFIANQIFARTRSFFKQLISEGHITVNGSVVSKSGYRVKQDDKIEISFPELKPVNIKEIVGDLGVEVIFNHSDFVIVSKPTGLVVHAPHEDYTEITLVDWLLHHFAEIAEVGDTSRPGIVHRLDMNTSGLMVVPKNNEAMVEFGKMFKERTIKKIYLAVVNGHPEKKGEIDFHIVRHPVHRNKMTHVPEKELLRSWAKNARASKTLYKVKEYFADTSLVEVHLLTGRTHQIRVHFAAINHSLVGDATYGKKSKLINYQALHAHKLSFSYKGEEFSFESPLPEEIKKLTIASI